MSTLSLQRPNNKVVPALGQVLSIYLPGKEHARQGVAGKRTVIVVGYSPRYVTVYYIPRLLAIKIRRSEWPRLSVVRAKGDKSLLLEALHRAEYEAQAAGKRFDKACAKRVAVIIQTMEDVDADKALARLAQ